MIVLIPDFCPLSYFYKKFRQEIFMCIGTVCADGNSSVSQHRNGVTVHCKAVKHVNEYKMFQSTCHRIPYDQNLYKYEFQ